MVPWHYFRTFTLEALSFQVSLELRTSCLIGQLISDGWEHGQLSLKPRISTACPGEIGDDLTELALESRDALSEALREARNLARCLGVESTYTKGCNGSDKVCYQKKECIRIIRPSLFDVPSGLLSQLSMRAEFWKIFIETLFVEDRLQLGFISSMFGSLKETPEGLVNMLRKAFSMCPQHGPCIQTCAAAAFGLAQFTGIFKAITRTLRLWPRTGARSQWRMPWFEPLGIYGGAKSLTSIHPCRTIFKAPPANGSGEMCSSSSSLLPSWDRHTMCSKAHLTLHIWSN